MTEDRQAPFQRLSEFTAEMLRKRQIPGASMGVLAEGEILTAGLGVTNADHPLPVTDETLFQIGSITKTFTVLAAMRLVEMGKLDLDATVRTYLPQFRVADEAASAQATLRHLFTHTAGWVGDFFDDTGAGDDALSRYVTNMANLEQLAPVGTVWSYNNAGFSLAGHVIEVVTGKSYQAALRELVLEPLGLQHCHLNPGDVMTHGFAVGHQMGEKGPQVARPWPLPTSAHPAGGIVCHVKDLLLYARFHLADGTTADGTKLLSPESMSIMHSPQVAIWGDKEEMGLSWFVNEIDGTRTLSHGGGTNGQVTLLQLVPGRRFAIAVFTNADQGGTVTGEVSRWALQQYLGLDSKDPAPIESTVEDLVPYAGRYVNPASGELEIGILGGRLVGQVTPKGGFPTRDSPPPPKPAPMAFAPCEKDRLLVVDGPFKGAKADFIRQQDGSIGWLRASGRIYRRDSRP